MDKNIIHSLIEIFIEKTSSQPPFRDKNENKILIESIEIIKSYSFSLKI